jgi:hypothetical protein
MSKKTRDLTLLISFIFLAIFSGMLLNLNEENNIIKEPFVPIINQRYKPFVRNIKNLINDRMNMVTKYFSVFLKKLKLI